MKHIFLFLIILLVCLTSVTALCLPENVIDGDMEYTWENDRCFSTQLICTDPLDFEVVYYDEILTENDCLGVDEGGCLAVNQVDGELIYSWENDKCFSTELTCTDPFDFEVVYYDEILTENDCLDVDENGCSAVNQVDGEPIYSWENDQCFSTELTCTDPFDFEVVLHDEIADENQCIGIDEDGCPFVNQVDGDDFYKWENNQCFTMKLTCSSPLNFEIILHEEKTSEAACQEIIVVNPQSSDGDSNSGSDDGSTSSSPGGSMIGVPLNIPESNPLFNDITCKKDLYKQKCVDGYRTYSCESYNQQGKYKKYTLACASCNNNQKDHNEDDVDCGGACPACLVSGKGSTTTHIKFDDDQVTLSQPGSMWRWFIPFLVLILIAGLMIGLILIWHYKDKKHVPVVIKESSDVLNGIPVGKINLMRQFIKIELVKGLERGAITSKLASRGWKKPVIDHVFEEMQHHVIPSEYEEQLRKYIGFYIHKGVHKEKLRDSLIKAGWKKETIEKVMRKDF
ncbi:hypothetical protein HOC35_00570 [Candidatus Woesearchaeota archaeon]|jgi:hypothetical protein|nr:hypothetical protein [Candidatus Woesearchaeota archaeon]